MSETGVENENEFIDHLVDLYQSDAVGDEAIGVLATRIGIEVDEISGEEAVSALSVKAKRFSCKIICALSELWFLSVFLT